MTAKPTDSFKQFHYGLRPSKQVERKIMIEVLLRLSNAGYSMTNYTYLGFGSPYYVDFVMFHKYLFIERMICVEWGDIKKRMRFNKPFKFIKLRLGALLTHIPSIRPNTKYLVWLDYDRSLDLEVLQDLDGCLTRMARNSIFIVTVDARPKLPTDEFELEDKTTQQRERLTAKVYREWFRSYIDESITRDSISRSHVANLFYRVIAERIRLSLSKREGDLRFFQIFNYVYRDGAPMLTVGGIVCDQQDYTALQQSGVLEHRFVRNTDDALEISVPPLTFREKQWLDSRLDKKLKADKLVFELEEEFLRNYKIFYKEYPTFVEMLL
jgi:hypothetical protein